MTDLHDLFGLLGEISDESKLSSLLFSLKFELLKLFTLLLLFDGAFCCFLADEAFSVASKSLARKAVWWLEASLNGPWVSNFDLLVDDKRREKKNGEKCIIDIFKNLHIFFKSRDQNIFSNI